VRWDLGELVLRDVELFELRQRRDRRRDPAQLIALERELGEVGRQRVWEALDRVAVQDELSA
jgi:hypothetical protein